MEAASRERALGGERAQRIVDAMRESVARRGAAGSTFDHVAREAGVSRGLLHYYFQTKERLLVEVVRRDTEIRLGILDRALEGAHTADDLIDALVRSLERMVAEDPGYVTLVFELFTAARRNDEIATEVAEVIELSLRDLQASYARKRLMRRGVPFQPFEERPQAWPMQGAQRLLRTARAAQEPAHDRDIVQRTGERADAVGVADPGLGPRGLHRGSPGGSARGASDRVALRDERTRQRLAPAAAADDEHARHRPPTR